MQDIIAKIKHIKTLRTCPTERLLINTLLICKKGYSIDYPKNIYFSVNGKVIFIHDERLEYFWITSGFYNMIIDIDDIKITKIVNDILKINSFPPRITFDLTNGIGYPKNIVYVD